MKKCQTIQFRALEVRKWKQDPRVPEVFRVRLPFRYDYLLAKFRASSSIYGRAKPMESTDHICPHRSGFHHTRLASASPDIRCQVGSHYTTYSQAWLTTREGSRAAQPGALSASQVKAQRKSTSSRRTYTYFFAEIYASGIIRALANHPPPPRRCWRLEVGGLRNQDET